MNSLPDALADALGRIVADVQRDWKKDVERLGAEGRAVVAELRADILGLKAELKEATNRELARVAEALANVKDGAPGKDGERGEPGILGEKGERGDPGTAGSNGERGEPGKDGEPGNDGADGKDGDPGTNGIDGRNGIDGLNGKDADLDLIAGMVTEAIAAIPAPKDGKDADPEQVAALVASEVSKAVAVLPEPKNGMDGTPGLNGKDGSPGKDGVDGAEGIPGRDGRDGLPGVQGEKGLDGKNGTDGFHGKDGRDGVDGLGFEDFSVKHDGERTVTFRWAREDRVEEVPIVFPVPLYRGVYKSGTQYQKGDSVTFGGSTHIAEADTIEKPESGKDWRLAVKHGRDGKDGKNGERGLQGIEGKAGRDLTQTDGSAKW